MSAPADSFIKQRARILALVEFTSRSDLQVIGDFQAYGEFDLVVNVLSGTKVSQKYFGVKLEGTTQLLSNPDEATLCLRSIYKEEAKEPLRKSGFPVITLLFSMRNDRGFYSWQIEPIIDGTNQPRLKPHVKIFCSPFDRSALGEIVERVNEWYDKLFALLVRT